MTPALHFTRFGKYEIIRKLGRSMTDVYLALDPEVNRRVVLKIVEQCRDPYTELVVEAERRGAAIQQQLHATDPSILEIYEYGDLNGCFYLAMQYVEGHTLSEIVRKEGRIEGVRAARYAAEVCRQLKILHAFQVDFDGQKRAVVHGDIKPSNIQIGAQGEVWLLDFGIAKAISATRNLTQHTFGSPAYCSPERLKNGQVDPRADLWAVGVCLYEMLSGIPPYQAQTTRKLENLIQSRRPPRALPDDCPAPLKAIIRKALAADNTRRYSSAAAFERDLNLFIDRKPVSAETEPEAAWDSNATLQQSRTAPAHGRTSPSITPKQKFAYFLAQFNVVVWSVIGGVIAGLVLFVPATHSYRFWRESTPLRAGRDYTHLDTTAIESDWRVLRGIEQNYPLLNRWSPGAPLREIVGARLIAAGSGVIDSFRDSTDADLAHFDWARAQLCLARALQLNPESAELKGKLALCRGYLSMLEGKSRAAFPSFAEASKLLPKSPDPHLALARLHVYEFHNLGAAAAEFHSAERLGYSLGPRELEQQADAYLFRAEQEFRKWQRAAALDEQRRQAALMQRDLERARSLYEPISGFSKVDASLERISRIDDLAEQLRAARERARAIEAARRRSRYTRRWR